LRANDLVRVFGDRRVLSGVSLIVSPGQRVGLVGENGVGKSTLLRLLAGLDEPDGGSVLRPPDTGFLHQEPPFPATATVADVLADALSGIRAALRRHDELAAALEDPRALAEYGELLEWLTRHEAWDAGRRAELVLAGLGLAEVAHDRPLEELSGGQRSRLALAALLIRRPAAVLLDEPTNHLDDAAIDFLERHLAALPGVVLLASHDRVFLDAVCTDIVDLDPAVDGPTRYGGAYTDYLAAKRAQARRWAARYAEEQQELVRLRHSVAVTSRAVSHDRPMRDRDKMQYGYHGERVQQQISRRVRSAQQRLAELTRDQVRKPPPPLRFTGRLTSDVDGCGPVLAVREIIVPGRLRLDRLDLAATGKLLITGRNGAGKSTLLDVLAGNLAPRQGSVSRMGGVRIGLLPQDVRFARPERTAQEVYTDQARNGIALSELGLLPGSALPTPVGALSVGQRRRLALALLVAAAPQVLLLDEPTNHISLALAEELEEALHSAPGAIAVASHDRWLRRRWAGEELAL
jgi:macrolide transport system ATP-binding/permease protein